MTQEEKSIIVSELIKQLSQFDPNQEVNIYAVGITASDSWQAKMILAEHTVDEFDGIVRISFSRYN